MNRSRHYDYIEKMLSIFVNRVNSNNKLNLMDLNIHSEAFAINMLNLLYDYQLVNLNSKDQNIAGIDLADTKKKIIVQVTSTCTKEKIESSLNKEILKKYNEYTFKIFILSENDKTVEKLKKMTFKNPHGIIFTPAKDIIDINKIKRDTLNLEIDKQKEFYNFIKKELGDDEEIIDSKEILIPYDIDPEEINSIFVETEPYLEILKKLDTKEGIVIITGDPGIGKTISSQKAALHYAEQGFSIFYSDDGDMSNLPDIMNDKHPEKKCLILLNDFLGQLSDESLKGLPQELERLLNFVKRNGNKKLIINSRMTVYNAAKENLKFDNLAQKYSTSNYRINFTLNSIDKANILHSHIKNGCNCGKIIQKQWNAIKQEHTLEAIVHHKNFMPRVIWYITNVNTGTNETDPKEYGTYFFQKLNEPEKIWEHEIVNLPQLDRSFLYILYSLTNTTVSKKILNECFNKRIEETNMDLTLNHFNTSLQRLSDSLVKLIITDAEEGGRISVMNPSINDYLKKSLQENELLVKDIMQHAVYLEQILRCESSPAFKKYIIPIIHSKSLNQYKRLPETKWPTSRDYYEHIERLILYLKCIVLYHEEIDEQLALETIKYLLDHLSAPLASIYSKDLTPIYRKMFSEPNISTYDFSVLMNNEDYMCTILSSIQEEHFWTIWSSISKSYYKNNEIEVINRYKNIFIDQISDIAISKIYDEIEDIIREDISDTLDINGELMAEYDDDQDDIILSIEGNLTLVNNLCYCLNDAIKKELEDHNIINISIDDFDSTQIISEQLDLNNMISDIYNEQINMLNSEQKEYNQRFKKIISDLSQTELF